MTGLRGTTSLPNRTKPAPPPADFRESSIPRTQSSMAASSHSRPMPDILPALCRRGLTQMLHRCLRHCWPPALGARRRRTTFRCSYLPAVCLTAACLQHHHVGFRMQKCVGICWTCVIWSLLTSHDTQLVSHPAATHNSYSGIHADSWGTLNANSSGLPQQVHVQSPMGLQQQQLRQMPMQQQLALLQSWQAHAVAPNQPLPAALPPAKAATEQQQRMAALLDDQRLQPAVSLAAVPVAGAASTLQPMPSGASAACSSRSNQAAPGSQLPARTAGILQLRPAPTTQPSWLLPMPAWQPTAAPPLAAETSQPSLPGHSTASPVVIVGDVPKRRRTGSASGRAETWASAAVRLSAGSPPTADISGHGLQSQAATSTRGDMRQQRGSAAEGPSPGSAAPQRLVVSNPSPVKGTMAASLGGTAAPPAKRQRLEGSHSPVPVPANAAKPAQPLPSPALRPRVQQRPPPQLSRQSPQTQPQLQQTLPQVTDTAAEQQQNGVTAVKLKQKQPGRLRAQAGKQQQQPSAAGKPAGAGTQNGAVPTKAGPVSATPPKAAVPSKVQTPVSLLTSSCCRTHSQPSECLCMLIGLPTQRSQSFVCWMADIAALTAVKGGSSSTAKGVSCSADGGPAG